MLAEINEISLGKAVLITGASSGFGLAATQVFLVGGWKVYAAVRGGMEREELFSHLIPEHSSSLDVVPLDLCEKSSIQGLSAYFSDKSLDVLINNAGYGVFGAVEDVSEESLRQQMEVNFIGTFLLTQVLLPNVRARRGVIITVSSVVGRHALPLTSAYCASKFAVEGWMESLAMEIKPFGVDCYLIEPGTYPTSFGDRISWAKSSAPYREVILGYVKLRSKVYEGAKNRSIDSIARKMLQLAMKRPRALRHPMGPDAHATMIAARILPPNLLHSIARFFLNFLLRREARVP